MRLLALDHGLERPRLPWLVTEAEKVAAFEALGIERGILPQRAFFVYVEPGHETPTALRSGARRTATSGRAL